MRAKSKLLALALTAALQPAFATVVPISVNFEDISSSVDSDGVLSLLDPGYAGVPGVKFKGSAWGIGSQSCNALYAFSFTPGAAGGCNAFLLAGPDLGAPGGTQTATINLVDGFVTGDTSSASSKDRSYLYYSALLSSSLSITAYEGLDGTGKDFKFAVSDIGGCGASAAFCTWTRLNLDVGSFTAHSLVISGIDQKVLLDDLQFIAPSSTQPPSALPEPGGIALALGALGALAWSRKRASASS